MTDPPLPPSDPPPPGDREAPFGAGIFGLPIPEPRDAAQGREPLEVLASQFVEALRAGNQPSIDEYALRSPRLASEILELFPFLAAMEGWKSHTELTSFDHRSLRTLTNERLGEFEILREIGRGGMGIVFEAVQRPGHRHVAVKVLPYLRSKERRERFEREAQMAAQLQHRHIVPVYGYGEHDGVCYYVMRLVKGVGLDWVMHRLRDREGIVYADEVAARFSASPEADPPIAAPREAEAAGSARSLGRNAWPQIARIGVQVADALHHAHRHGTLHRDIKPANLLLDAAGSVWITDFGLAQESREVLSHGGTGAGTLRYMAPEQFSGRCDVRSDLYSFGVTLFELLTLKPAFQAVDRRDLVEAITGSSLTPPRQVNPQVPEDLEAIVLTAAAKDPDKRYRSAGELWTDLLRFLKGERVRARRRSRWRWLSR